MEKFELELAANIQIDHITYGIFSGLDTIRNAYYNELAQIASDLKFPLEEYGCYPVSIQIGEMIPSDFGHIGSLKISTSVTIDPQKFPVSTTVDNEVQTPKDVNAYKALIRMSLPFVYRKSVCDFLVLSQLCYPGAIQTCKIEIMINGQVQIAPFELNSILPQAIVEHKDKAWPPISTLSLKKTIQWLSDSKSLIPLISKTNVERAIAAFSNLFQAGGLAELTLLWTMVGIEALFSKSKQGIMEQIREKIHVLIGYPETHKKRLSAMYDYRSKFIHGATEIPANHYGMLFKTEKVVSAESETWETVTFSAVLLTSCLQKIVTLERRDLSFDYTLAAT